MLAKALAAQSGVTFIYTEGNKFLKKYVGEGPEKVHDLFRSARKYAPTIVFIDEIDAIAKERHGDERVAAGEETLTALLAEMDGFNVDSTKPVFVLAATNLMLLRGHLVVWIRLWLGDLIDAYMWIYLRTKSESNLC